MLSYRHGFHAGNHADIFKHLTLMLITQSLCKKEKPFCYFDTHAGAALYSLDDEWALQTGEADKGIKKMLELSAGDKIQTTAGNELILPYISYCKKLYDEAVQYPGSPAIVSHFARKGDQLVLMELHNTEIERLRANAEILKKENAADIHVHHRNGFEGLISMTPPKPPLPARGFVLIDPSYETDSDYNDVAETALAVNKKWSTGIICIWYPLIQNRSAEIEKLKASVIYRDIKTLNAELCVSKPKERGLYGSGMLIINPPWQLSDKLRQILPQLARILGEQSEGSCSVEATEDEPSSN